MNLIVVEVLATLLVALGAIGSTLAAILGRLRRSRANNLRTAQQDAARLEQWRSAGLLVMSEEDFRTVLAVGDADPGYLRHLVRELERIMGEHEMGSGSIHLALKREYEPERASERGLRGRLQVSYALG